MQNWSLLSSKIHLCLSYTLKSFIKELDDKKLMSYHAYENVFDDITLSETEETFEKWKIKAQDYRFSKNFRKQFR